MKYKKILVSFLLVAIVFPSFAIAKSENAEENKGKGFCERISSLSENINKRIGNNGHNLYQKRIEINDQFKEKRREYLENKEQRREKWDINREEHFSKLKEKAGTNEQKEAINRIMETLQIAISARREAIDMAINKYRQELDKLKEDRKVSVDNLIKNYKANIQLVFEKAQADCENGADPKTVNERIRTELKDLKDSFIKEKKGLSDIKGALRELVSVKKKAMETAISEFKITAQITIADLKNVIK